MCNATPCLPDFRGYVGELEAKSINFARAVDNTTKYYLFTHFDFSVAYNKDRIIEVNVTADPLQRLDLSTSQEHKVRPPPPPPPLLDLCASVAWPGHIYSPRLIICHILNVTIVRLHVLGALDPDGYPLLGAHVPLCPVLVPAAVLRNSLVVDHQLLRAGVWHAVK